MEISERYETEVAGAPGWQRWETFSVRDIPDEIQAELMGLASMDHANQFRLGRIVVTLRAGLDSKRLIVPAMRLYKAVAALAGCSSEHVRQCYQVAKQVSPRLEHKYDMIGFHQWKAIVPHAATERDMEALVEAWLDHCAETGVSVTSVDGIRGWLTGEDGGDAIAWRRYQSLLRLLERLVGDQAVPGHVRSVLREALKALSRREAKWERDKLM